MILYKVEQAGTGHVYLAPKEVTHEERDDLGMQGILHYYIAPKANVIGHYGYYESLI